VAKLIYRDLNHFPLVPSTQFRGCNASSTLDAGLTLLHNIQSVHQAGLKCGLLLFDIQGFFDNINRNRLVQVFVNLGFTPELVNWCRSFLTDRTVRLKFNSKSLDPIETEVGTSQGLPVSPVLSIIYTMPLLHQMRSWTNASLGMYIDNGAIFTCGKDWDEVADTLHKGYSKCIDWLTHAGLKAELDKTKLIFFKKRRDNSTPPQHINLPLPDNLTHY